MAITTSDLFSKNFELTKTDFGDPFPFPIIISNNQAYKCLIVLKNENCERVLNVNTMQEFEIVDNILNWGGLNGHIVIEDKMNVIERGNSMKATSKSFTNSEFVFRNDGRDFLRIEIYPVDLLKKGHEIPDEWKILYTFSITKIEDIPSENNINKFKKYIFVMLYIVI
jgi:hypothetical protein